MRRRSQEISEIEATKEDMIRGIKKYNIYKEVLSDFGSIAEKLDDELFDMKIGAEWVIENIDGLSEMGDIHTIELDIEDIINAENRFMKLVHEIRVMMNKLVKIDERELFDIEVG